MAGAGRPRILGPISVALRQGMTGMLSADFGTPHYAVKDSSVGWAVRENCSGFLYRGCMVTSLCFFGVIQFPVTKRSSADESEND